MIIGGGSCCHLIAQVNPSKSFEKRVRHSLLLIAGKADVTAVIPYAPRFPVTVYFWCGDKEFPASGKTLVDAAAEHYLTLEAAGGACSSVVQAIIAACKAG